MKKTLLHIAKYYHPNEGGIETVTKYLAEGLGEYDNVVVCFSQDGHDAEEVVGGVKVYRVAPFIKVASQDLAWSYYFKLKAIIKKHQPAILLLHCPNPFLYPITLRLKPKDAKLVLLWHSDILGKGMLYKLVSKQEKKLLGKADLILATSDNYVHPTSPIYPHREGIRVVQNGIIADDFNLKPGDDEKVDDIRKKFGNKKIVFYVGRHIPYKGIDLLLQAEKKVKTDCVFVIGGTGVETPRLKAMANSERVVFVGRIPEEQLKYYYHAADVFGFASITKQEAFGIALAEAMYCRCVPVTFTLVGSGVNWVSIKGETGEEVPLGDIDAYAEAIDKLLVDDKLRDRYAEAGRKRVAEMFTCDRSVEEARKALDALLDNHL
ncbi:MAG: glycosyltransferase [Prevotella sp.]|nr:glycosyltransferase [Prevotella sp.]